MPTDATTEREGEVTDKMLRAAQKADQHFGNSPWDPTDDNFYARVYLAMRSFDPAIAKLERELAETKNTLAQVNEGYVELIVARESTLAMLAALRAAPCRVEHEPTAVMVESGRGDGLTSKIEARRIYRAMERARIAECICTSAVLQSCPFDHEGQLQDLEDARAAQPRRSDEDRLKEAFIRGLKKGSERPDDAGDAEAMYQHFKGWFDQLERARIADASTEAESSPWVLLDTVAGEYEEVWRGLLADLPDQYRGDLRYVLSKEGAAPVGKVPVVTVVEPQADAPRWTREAPTEAGWYVASFTPSGTTILRLYKDGEWTRESGRQIDVRSALWWSLQLQLPAPPYGV